MYAIVETGGKQYAVSPGEVVRVERLEGDEGAKVEFDRVVAVSKDDGAVVAGADAKDAKVVGTIEKQGKAKKVIVFKFKRRKQYKRRQGHRQDFTAVKIDEIVC